MNAGDYNSDYDELDVGSDADQYLTFLLADEEYGVDIHKIQEVRGWETVTPIPQAPGYIKGVINLRGDIVPVIDLRERFGQEMIPYGPRTVVIVIKVPGGGNTHTMGIVVDAVSDVHNVGADELKPPPDFCSVIHAEFVKGIATVKDRMLILLDSDRLLRSDELMTLTRAVGAPVVKKALAEGATA
ncbi:chemotaxis protein CheW [Endothiovibrio diazotrophicus]